MEKQESTKNKYLIEYSHGAHVHIIQKSEFGIKAGNYLSKNLMNNHEYLNLNFIPIQHVTNEIIADSDLIFLFADKITQEELEKIFNFRSDIPIVVFGCDNPFPNMNFHGFFINESLELSTKIAEAIIYSSWGDGVYIEYSDIKSFFTQSTTTSFLVHIKSNDLKESITYILKKLSDKNISLEEVKHIFFNVSEGINLNFDNFYYYANLFFEHLNDHNLSKNAIPLISFSSNPRIQNEENELTVIITI